MSIQSYIKELESINAEIKRNNATNRLLRNRVIVLEKHITEYLDSKNQEGVKYNGKSFVLEDKISRKRLCKKDKEEEMMRLLSDLGVSDRRRALDKLLEVQKGEEIETRRLKIKNKNKKE